VIFPAPGTDAILYGDAGADTTVGRGATLPALRFAGVAASAFFSPEQPAMEQDNSSAKRALKIF
jgi:hypothetical protein